MKRTSGRAVSLVALAIVLSAAGARAASVTSTDLHVHAGFACVPKPGDSAKLAYNFAEGVRNISTSASATVFCPVDTVPVKQGADYVGGPQAVRVFVIDRSSAANISCTLKAIIENNGFATSNTYPVKSSTGSFPSVQMLQWTQADGPIAISNYTFRVSCTLPRALSASQQSAVQQTEVETLSTLIVQ
jgi:hypothetical protein